MPKGEYENFEAKDLAPIRKVSDEWVENVQFTKGEKEGAVDCALKNPSVFTPTFNLDEDMCASKIYEELTHRKELKTTLQEDNLQSNGKLNCKRGIFKPHTRQPNFPDRYEIVPL